MHLLSNRSFYVIEGFEPVDHVDIGRYYFSVGIERELAKKASEYELDDKMIKKFNEIALNRMKSTRLLKDDEFASPYGYRFYENNKKTTLLLAGLSVPGNACDLSMEWEEIEDLKEEKSYNKFFGYYPHNIDDTVQAYTLLSLWLTWAEQVKLICE